MATALSRYRSIRRPSPQPRGFSSYATTLAKRTQAAEDTIIDTQYAEGAISAEAYQMELSKRAARATLTPKQQVDLQNKISDVQTRVADAEMARRYQAGEVSTDDMLSYENQKLQRIKEPGTVAYQTQAKRVSELQDKSNREKRTQYRIQENLRIANMPEDSSENLLAKARMYERLENMARIDGDNNQADTFATSKVNYTTSARRAARADTLREYRGITTAEPRAGLGVPSSGGGAAIYSGQRAGTPASTVRTGAVGVPAQGRTGGGTMYGLNLPKAPGSGGSGAYRTLEKQFMQMDKLEQDRRFAQGWVQQFDNAIADAEAHGDVDQAETLRIQRNQYNNQIGSIDNSLANLETNIELQKEKIAGAQAAAYAKSVTNWKKIENRRLELDEDELETMLRDGKVSQKEMYKFLTRDNPDKESAKQIIRAIGNDPKALYLYSRYLLDKGKMTLADKVEELYEDIGKGDEGATFRSAKWNEVAKSSLRNLSYGKDFVSQKDILNHVRNFGKNFELVRDDKTRTVKIENYQTLKADPKFSGMYIRDKNGVLAKVHNLGNLDSAALVKSQAGKRYDVLTGALKPTYLDQNGKPQPAIPVITRGDKKDPTKITKIEFHTKEFIDAYKKQNKIREASGKTVAGDIPKGAGIYEFGAPIKKTPFMQQPLMKQAGDIASKLANTQPGTVLTSRGINVPAALGAVSNFVKNAFAPKTAPKGKMDTNIIPQNLRSSFDKAGKFITTASERVLEKLQPRKVYATEAHPKMPDAKQQDVKLIKDALKEQGIYDPKVLAYALATIDHETAGKFKPVNEGFYNDERYGYQPGFTGRSEARNRGYSGGEDFFGRGYIQLTHDYNYDKYGRKLGIDLVNNPELANDPKIAAKILALYFKERGTADLIKRGKVVEARGTINPDDKGSMLANTYQKYLQNIGKYDPATPTPQLLASNKKPVPWTYPMKDKKQDNIFTNIGKFGSDIFGKAREGFIKNWNQGKAMDKARNQQPMKRLLTQDLNKNNKLDFGETVTGQAINKYVAPTVKNIANDFTTNVKKGAQTVMNWVAPQTQAQRPQPQVQQPRPQLQPIRNIIDYNRQWHQQTKTPLPPPPPPPKPAPKPTVIQRVAAPVVKAVQSVGNWVGNLFKKKK